MKLKTKFILPTLILIIVGTSITTWFTYKQSAQTLAKEIIDNSETSVSNLLTIIDLWIRSSQNEIKLLSKTNEVRNVILSDSVTKEKLDTASSLLEKSISNHSTFNALLVINTKGIVVTASDPKLVNVDMTNREYFQKSLQGEEFVSSPIFNKASGQPILAISVPIKNNGKIIGVLALGIELDKFTKKYINQYKTEGEYLFITDANGLTLAHPDVSLVGKANVMDEPAFGSQLRKNSNGVFDTVALGVKKLMVFKKSPQTGWIVCMAAIKSIVFKDSEDLGILILLLSAGQALLLLGGIWIILSLFVVQPVHGLVTSATQIAEGNLNSTPDVNRSDEIGTLQKALNAMVETLKLKIDEAESQSNRAQEETQKAQEAMLEAQQAKEESEKARKEGMFLAAKQLEGVVSAVSAATESISNQIEQSSYGSQEQSNRVAETATAMEQMNSTVLEVAQNASQAASVADTTRQKAREGSDIVSQVITGINAAQRRALALKEDMGHLGEQAQGIGDIMNVISDIADQTNLLALNAAIEAARAGEAGRGFAVVADEVRKLAEKTMIATKEVGDAIVGIQKGTNKNIENVNQAVQFIDEATTSASQSGEALETIVSLVEQTSDQVRSIATAAEEQSATSDEINRSVMDISRIASETDSALQESLHTLSELREQATILDKMMADMQADTVESSPLSISQ